MKSYIAVNLDKKLKLDLGQAESWTEVAPHMGRLAEAMSDTLDSAQDLLEHRTLEYRYPNCVWSIWSKD